MAEDYSMVEDKMTIESIDSETIIKVLILKEAYNQLEIIEVNSANK